MHTNHSFVVVAAVKAQFREPSTPRLLIQPRRRTHRTRWSWRGENPVQWWHNLDSSSEKLGLQRSRVMATPLAGGSAVSTADYPGGWGAGCHLCPDSSAGKRTVKEWHVPPLFTLHCKACCYAQAAMHTKNWNHSAWRCEVHCNHWKPPCWPHWLSIL